MLQICLCALLMHTVFYNCVFPIVEVAKDALTKSITEKQTTNCGQLVNTIVYNYEFIEDYCDDNDGDAAADDALPSKLFPMTSCAQISSSDGLEWLIDPNDEGSFSTSTEQETDKQNWRHKTFSYSRHPLHLMVRAQTFHCRIIYDYDNLNLSGESQTTEFAPASTHILLYPVQVVEDSTSHLHCLLIPVCGVPHFLDQLCHHPSSTRP